MKYLFFIVLTILIALPSSAMSEDGKSFFMDNCIDTATRSQSACECALKAYSEKLMAKENSRSKVMEKKFVHIEKQILKLDSSMTKKKIDEAYALYASMYEYQIIAVSSRGDDRKKYRAKAEALMQERNDLVRSFTDSGFTIKHLTGRKYYINRFRATRIKKDIAEYDGVMYGPVKREMERKSSSSIRNIITVGKGNNCF